MKLTVEIVTTLNLLGFRREHEIKIIYVEFK